MMRNEYKISGGKADSLIVETQQATKADEAA
jgi:hypothetical protein